MDNTYSMTKREERGANLVSSDLINPQPRKRYGYITSEVLFDKQ